ncbi:hypothetical protein P3G55_23915 [Leptospira sp. 96542]|nr:hypothetical protein [Leptospira sp. 96542]
MASISVSFSPASQPATKAASQLNGMLQVAASMQAIRRDASIPESMKEDLLKPLLAQTQVIEDEVVRKSEEKEKASAVSSAGAVSDAVTAAAGQAPAEGAAAQTAADGTPLPQEAVPAPQPVSTYTPDAVVSQPSTVGATVDTYA